VLRPSEGGLGGQDAPDGFPASGRNAYPSRANTFFADVLVSIVFKGIALSKLPHPAQVAASTTTA